MRTLESHVLHFCGPTSEAWAEDGSGILVGRYDGKPIPELTTFLTAGLSAQRLTQPSGREISQELLCTTLSRYKHLPFQRLLLASAKLVLKEKRALQRGQLLGPLGPLFKEAPRLQGFYCGYPSYFEDEFIILDRSPPIVFVELYPITVAEMEYVRSNGALPFEEAVESGGIDLLDMERPELPEAVLGRFNRF